jgi:phosphomannomutase
MSKAAIPLSELRKPFERYADSGEINTKVRDVAVILAGMEERFATAGASLDHLDGLTVDLGSWWFNLRPSNTEPLLRLNLEANSAEECADHVAEVRRLIGHFDDPTTTGSSDHGA